MPPRHISKRGATDRSKGTQVRGRNGSVPGLDEQDRELLLEELDGFTSSLADEESKIPYLALRRDIEAGKVSAEHIPRLENILELTLQSGRVRRRQSAVAEKRLLRLFNGTPRGAAVKQAVAETNEALASLKGQVLDTLSFTPGTPGTYRLLIDTEACRVNLEITRDGVSVKDVEIGI